MSLGLSLTLKEAATAARKLHKIFFGGNKMSYAPFHKLSEDDQRGLWYEVLSKWFGICYKGGRDNGTADCAFCRLYHHIGCDDCSGCPISIDNGGGYCKGTPYQVFDKHCELCEECYLHKNEDPIAKSFCIGGLELAKNEFEYLMNLCPFKEYVESFRKHIAIIEEKKND